MLKWFEKIVTDKKALDDLGDGPSEHNEYQCETEQSGDDTDVVSNLQFNPRAVIPKFYGKDKAPW